MIHFHQYCCSDIIRIEDEEETKGDTSINIDEDDDSEVASGEFIFIIDRSGSMGGSRINLAVEALMLFIRSLPPDSLFNVVSFGSSYKLLFKKNKKYDDNTMQQALSEIELFDADFGGTVLEGAINSVLS